MIREETVVTTHLHMKFATLRPAAPKPVFLEHYSTSDDANLLIASSQLRQEAR